MPDATMLARPKQRIALSELANRIEEVLRENNREGARAMLPELRTLCGKLRRLRRLGIQIGAVRLSKYVLAVGALAGHREEFAEFA